MRWTKEITVAMQYLHCTFSAVVYTASPHCIATLALAGQTFSFMRAAQHLTSQRDRGSSVGPFA
jgi:hypothetical protein